jgi:hypothetical protein
MPHHAGTTSYESWHLREEKRRIPSKISLVKRLLMTRRRAVSLVTILYFLLLPRRKKNNE